VIVVDLQDSEGLTALMYATFTSSRGSSDDYSCLAFSAARQGARDAAPPHRFAKFVQTTGDNDGAD